MRREVTLAEISDGKLYGLNDMVKAGCNGCIGCSACCRGMGSSITLDPADVWRLTTGLEMTFEQLLNHHIELNVVDGVILPNLKMAGPDEACSFLDEHGRCRIHAFRPGICRLFPLGRYYDNNTFRYFLQVHECKKENRMKVKVRKWIDMPDIQSYEAFINDWHYFLLEMQAKITGSADGEMAKWVSMYLLKQFYMLPYGSDDFYREFTERLTAARIMFPG